MTAAIWLSAFIACTAIAAAFGAYFGAGVAINRVRLDIDSVTRNVTVIHD